MSSRKYFCPNDNTEVDAETAENGKCPECGYGPATNWHQRDWLNATQMKEREQEARDRADELAAANAVTDEIDRDEAALAEKNK